MQKLRLLTIVGPTAVGKSDVALILAQRLEGEIVSADSMQVYRGMDLGTAKPSLAEQALVRHHLIDLVEPDSEFSVAQYQSIARETIAQIHQRGKLPILVGGSGLYIRAVIDKLNFPPTAGILGKIRKDLQEEAKTKSLFQELARLDPEGAERIDPTNTRRIIRALEVIRLTGRPFSQYQKEWPKRESIYDLRIFGLSLPRSELYRRIEDRVDRMFKEGFLEEVKGLVAQGYSDALTSRQALGYKETLDYLKGDFSWAETVELIKKKTRHLAKRQMTWFGRDPRIEWIDLSGKSPSTVASEIISQLKDWW